MPWTIDDVDKHKKGLSKAQKKKWVAIANATLESCQSEGKKNCDVMAIRTANSQVSANMEVIKVNLESTYSVRETEWDGKNYIIVPVVMMVEGVHNGQYHSSEELGMVVPAWNGIPVTIGHPEERNNFISANSPSVLSDWAVGRIFNAYMDGEKLKAEAWIDIEKLETMSPRTLTMLRANEVIEVSVGVFQDSVEEEGTWNEEQYNIVAKNLRPDHLALLPDEVGACSVEDGCGVRVNQQQTESLKTKGKEFNNVKEGKTYKVQEDGIIIHPMVLSNNKMSLIELLDKVTSVVYSMDSESESYYIQEVYEDAVIYSVRNRNSNEVAMYKRTYQINSDGTIELTGDPVKVMKKVEYEIVTNKKEEKMCNTCKEKASALIANEKTHFTEDDRSWLEGLSEDKLDKMIPKTVTVTTNKEVSLEEAWRIVKEKSQVSDYTSKLSDEVITELVNNRKEKEERKELEKMIVDNTEMTDEEIAVMPFSVLKKLGSTFEKGAVVDYSVRGYTDGKQATSKSKIAPMPVAGIKFE